MIGASGARTGEAARSATRVGFWRRIFIVNAVAAFAAFGLLGGLVASEPWSKRWIWLAVSFVYSNSIGGIAALVMPKLSARFCDRSRPVQWIVRLAATPVVIVAGCLLAGAVLMLLGVIGPRQYLPYFYGSLWISFVVGTAACLTVITYETLRSQIEATTLALRTKELEEERARKLAAEAQLASLESRVQPHFLFNTLNSIAALVHEDPPRAERMTTQLASLLRSSLDHTSPLVPLGDELQTVRDYLDIERVRFGERLRYAIDVDAALHDARVPRLAVQTLVENSVKYAVSPRREGGSIVVRAAANNGHLQLEVRDNGPGFDPSALPEGHGLSLLRSRLAMSFGDRASLRIASTPDGTRATIDVPPLTSG